MSQARTMSLKEQIMGLSPVVADALARAGITDAVEIQELTREDLNELLPGFLHFKLRKKISELINTSKQDTAKPLALILNNLGEFLPVEVMENALVPGGVLRGYLPILRDLEKQLAKVLNFIQAHVRFLESYIAEESMEAQSSAESQSVDSATAGNQPSNVADLCADDTQLKRPISDASGGQNRQTPYETSISHPHTSHPSGATGADTQSQRGITGAPQSSTGSGQTEPQSKLRKSNSANHSGAAAENQLSAKDKWYPTVEGGFRNLLGNYTQNEKRQVKVHSRVCGKTLNTHLALMKQVDDLGVGLKREETSAEDCQVLIVFCPITSRVVTDIDAAMSQVPSNRYAILVVMHHTFDRYFVTSQRSASHYKNVEEVHVLFHDSEGLLPCETNAKAVTLIHKVLQKYSSSAYTR